jgi:hypothetical protein
MDKSGKHATSKMTAATGRPRCRGLHGSPKHVVFLREPEFRDIVERFKHEYEASRGHPPTIVPPR